jgi:predicted phosphodiesterase
MKRRTAIIGIVAGLALALALPAFWRNSPTESALLAFQPLDAAAKLTLPLKSGSVRFAVIGDDGTGKRDQYEVAQQMAAYHQRFPFGFVIMLGDNLYGGDSPSDYQDKFEQPYQTLLGEGVKFYASLGNHDNPNERFYKPFNMGGQRYYTFKKGNVRFFALDSNYMDEQQMNWLQQQLGSADSHWKICFFHHPLYSDGMFHGPDLDLRKRLEPILEKYGVNVVFSGHEHVYERILPQNGIYYFVEGSSGELRYHNLRPAPEMARGFDTDRAFMLVEIAGDQLYFQVISRTGETVDSGILARQTPS